MRPELLWDRDPATASTRIMIERAITFGGFDFIAEVQRRYGLEAFIDVLKTSRNLGRKAVNYWCLVLGLDREETATFRTAAPTVWSPWR